MTRFSKEDWPALSRLLDEALDLSVDERVVWLANQRAQNPMVAAELEALLHHESTMDRAGFLGDDQAAKLPRWSTLAGQTFGGYLIERPLGQGGMGSVWLARRADGRFEGSAAIKFLSLAVAGPVGEERFRREGTALARLAHPNIARLLDAGISPVGLPYLVLEFVEGKPIDEWCDAHKLSVDARLRLFQQVLAAVSHAHANFIVHRDLKPANILVTEDGTVKLLDFGIAKLLEEGGEVSNELTGAQGVFTYKYAAPEQIQNEPITIATDVYSLGVILYELLAGTHPTSGEARTPAEHVVAILNTESGPLSLALTRGGSHKREDVERLAAARDTSPERLRRSLAGDLDNIVAKALKKVPGERYPTVGAFADDIEHHLNHEPVSARADSFGYRAGKFVRRHRLQVTLAALATIALIGAATRERQLRGRAESEARKAVAVEDYLVSIFGAADPFVPTANKPNDVTARALLDRGAARIDTSLANQPDVRAELRGALGGVYMNLGVYDKATKQLRQSLAERRALYGRDNASVAQAMDQLGDVLTKQDSLAEADTLLRGALAIRRKLFGENNDATAQSLDHLAELFNEKDNFPEAEPLYRSALRVRRELHGDSDLTVATSRVSLGELLLMRSENKEAISEFQQALAIRERQLGPNHPATAEAIRRMAKAEERMGHYPDAEQHYRQALAIDCKALGNDHRNVTSILNDLGQMLFKVGRLDEADSLLREALAIDRRIFGENHDAVSSNLSNLALVVRERGEFDEAEALLTQALAIDRTLYGHDHVSVAFYLNEMAVVLRLEGRPDSAAVLLRQALAINQKLQGPDELGTLVISVNLGRALAEAGHYAEAEKLMKGALAKMDTSNADAQSGIIPGRIGIGRVLLATHRAKEAVPTMEGAVEMSLKRLGAKHWRTAEAQVVLAECLMAVGEFREAAEPLKEGSDVLEKSRKSHPGLVREAESANAAFSRDRVR
jgi:serine/threonine protein kinase/tetratricopeptide (TPR) repeat protein